MPNIPKLITGIESTITDIDTGNVIYFQYEPTEAREELRNRNISIPIFGGENPVVQYTGGETRRFLAKITLASTHRGQSTVGALGELKKLLQKDDRLGRPHFILFTYGTHTTTRIRGYLNALTNIKYGDLVRLDSGYTEPRIIHMVLDIFQVVNVFLPVPVELERHVKSQNGSISQIVGAEGFSGNYRLGSDILDGMTNTDVHGGTGGGG